MKLHHVLENLLSSKSKIKILEFLFRFPGKESSIREIANHVNISPNTVSIVMQDFRKTNLLKYRIIGDTHSYRLNLESVLYPMFRDLFKKEDNLMESLILLIKEYMNEADICVLFGSFARGTEEPDSDLDLLIVTDQKWKLKKNLDSLFNEVSTKYGTVISPMVFTHRQFNSMRKKPFVINAFKEGIFIKGSAKDEH